MGIIINFIKKFVLKYMGSLVIEKIIIVLIRELVERSDSNVDDEIYRIIFEKIKE